MLLRIVSIALPALAGLCLLAALVFFLQGINRRTVISRQPYSVGQQQARQDMQVAFARGVLLLLVGLILFGVFGINTRPDGLLAPTPTPTATATATATAVPTAAPTATNTPLPAPATLEATPTSPVDTPTPEASPSPSATPEPSTAYVDSPIVGLYLREAPGGRQEVELLPDRTVLILLPGRAFANDLEWQQVRAPSGNEGWVAVDFIVYGPLPTPIPTATPTPES